ncbi:hypothetical protein SSX86_025350 [Deinandra increscens subsp. villosa]|uniref:AB hydrolase-1 domain-containing protein n=1 Tax=Deinandra increscens subsp. villosa TaxID=3103831 RepID=A0AAP0CHI5_9ASTR
MSAVNLSFSVCRKYIEASSVGIRSDFMPLPVISCKLPNTSRLSQSGTLCIQLSAKGQSRRAFTRTNIQMTLVDDNFGRGKVIITPSEILVMLMHMILFKDLIIFRSKKSFFILKEILNTILVDKAISDINQWDYVLRVISTNGIMFLEVILSLLQQVRWSYIADKSVPCPPTAVLLHGILGSRKNWGTFARRLAKEFPNWQFLLVDLRCHGDSASIKKTGPHTVSSAAFDVLQLLGHLKVTPRVIIGHSFGGKVALSMVEQAAKPLARPVRVWVLDATPGKVRAGRDEDDHPAELINFLNAFPNEVISKREVVSALVREGFSNDVAQWVVTNLRQTNPSSSSSGFSWIFNLDGISEMYQSYEDTNLWDVVEDVPRGVHVNFLKAERSLHRWALGDLQRIHAAEEQASQEGGGVEMHVLEDAGHWVHADNPDGLFRILSFSFEGV